MYLSTLLGKYAIIMAASPVREPSLVPGVRLIRAPNTHNTDWQAALGDNLQEEVMCQQRLGGGAR